MTNSHQRLVTALNSALSFTDLSFPNLLQFALMSLIFCSRLEYLFDFVLCVLYNLDCSLFFCL